MSTRLLVDVTQFTRWPATTGIQRVLRHLAEAWPGEAVQASFGFIEDGSYVTGPISEFASVIVSTFETKPAPDQSDIQSRSRTVQDALRRRADRIVPTDDVESAFDAYLLPEPTLCDDSLVAAIRLLSSSRIVPLFIHYDALPLTHPQLYPHGADGGALVTRYHCAVARSENVAFISETARSTFEVRIARRRPKNAIVARPGADGLRPRTGHRTDPSTFTIVGTVEPRKRHRLVLDAFEELWAAGRDYTLVVIGAAGWEQPDFLGRLETLGRTARLEWIDEASDEEVSYAMSRSSALVFVSDAEGYGLPPLEALALGCPVIVSADLPALESLPDSGQIRLNPVTVEGVRSAIETLADPDRNEEHRHATHDLRLPTWKQFARDIEEWVAMTLTNAREGEGSYHHGVRRRLTQADVRR